MKNFLAKQTIWSYILIASAILLIPGFIIFAINTTTGYFYGSGLDPLVATLSIVAIVLGIVLAIFGDKLGKWAGVGALLIAIMSAICIGGVAWSIESVVGDIFFIPVNYPESEDTAWALTIVTLVFYILAFVGSTAVTFSGKLFKEAE